jgi:hypothetical protein
VQQLAAWHAVGIEDEQLDHVDIGVVQGKRASSMAANFMVVTHVGAQAQIGPDTTR